MPDMTNVEARKLLKVWPAKAVSFTTKSGKLLDDEGDPISDVQTVPHVLALGPFGSWLCTLEEAEKDFANHENWYDCQSFRVGYAVVYKQGWGYAAKEAIADNL